MAAESSLIGSMNTKINKGGLHGVCCLAGSMRAANANNQKHKQQVFTCKIYPATAYTFVGSLRSLASFEVLRLWSVCTIPLNLSISCTDPKCALSVAKVAGTITRKQNVKQQYIYHTSCASTWTSQSVHVSWQKTYTKLPPFAHRVALHQTFAHNYSSLVMQKLRQRQPGKPQRQGIRWGPGRAISQRHQHGWSLHASRDPTTQTRRATKQDINIQPKDWYRGRQHILACTKKKKNRIW